MCSFLIKANIWGGVGNLEFNPLFLRRERDSITMQVVKIKVYGGRHNFHIDSLLSHQPNHRSQSNWKTNAHFLLQNRHKFIIYKPWVLRHKTQQYQSRDNQTEILDTSLISVIFACCCCLWIVVNSCWNWV